MGTLGQRVKDLSKAAGLTVRHLSEQSGLSHSSVSRL